MYICTIYKHLAEDGDGLASVGHARDAHDLAVARRDLREGKRRGFRAIPVEKFAT